MKQNNKRWLPGQGRRLGEEIALALFKSTSKKDKWVKEKTTDHGALDERGTNQGCELCAEDNCM
jgi:hypothetical protein